MPLKWPHGTPMPDFVAIRLIDLQTSHTWLHVLDKVSKVFINALKLLKTGHV